MTKNDVQKCLVSYGFFPMTKVLIELESKNRFEDCALILEAMQEYRLKFHIVEDDIPTQYSKEFEKEYFSYFKKSDGEGELIAKSNLEYYIKDIKERLKL